MEQAAFEKLVGKLAQQRDVWTDVRTGTAHILCPKLSDADSTNYRDLVEEHVEDENDNFQVITVETKQARLNEAASRTQITLNYSIVVGLDEKSAGNFLSEFKECLDASLSKCELCVRNWHQRRGPLISQLRHDYSSEVATIMEARYDANDFARISSGLRVIERIIDETPAGVAVTPSSIFKKHGGDVLLPLLEAFCSLRFLAMPEHRTLFNKVFIRLQDKKVLKLGDAGILPAMTPFLFDRDPVRYKFARNGWTSATPGCITNDEWDWAVGIELARQLQAVHLPAGSPEPTALGLTMLQSFWDAFGIMVKCFTRENIAEKLGFVPQDEQAKATSPYFVAMGHLSCDSPSLLAKIFSILAEMIVKAPDTFWLVFSTFHRRGVAESFVTARHFPTLLGNGELVLAVSSDVADSSSKVPLALCWLRPLLDSLKHATLRAAVGIDFFVPFFLKELPKDVAHATPTFLYSGVWGALVCIQSAIDSYRDPAYKMNTRDSLVGICRVVETVVMYEDVLISSTAASPSGSELEFEISKVATMLAQSALELDSLAFFAEWSSLYHKGEVQDRYIRPSEKLWRALLRLVKPGNLHLASVIVPASLKFLKTQPLVSLKHQKPNEAHIAWNKRLAGTAAIVGQIFDRLCDFTSTEQNMLLANPAVNKSLVHALFSSNQDLEASALQFIKSATDQDSRDDAVRTLLSQQLEVFLGAYTEAVSDCLEDAVICWGPMRQILNLNRSICTALCDTVDGLLRTQALSPQAQGLVQNWWVVQWTFIHRGLERTEDWSKTYSIENKVLSEYVRDAMQFADDLLDQDSVFASALGGNSDADSHKALRTMLASPQKCTGLSKMIRLRDQWLISVIVKILTKLFNRLFEFKIHVNAAMEDLVKATCIPLPNSNKYAVNSNLLPTQRAQLTQALRIHVDEDDSDDVTITKVQPTKAVKQTSIDAWSKPASIHDVMKQVTPAVSSSKPPSVLAQLQAKESSMKKLKQEKEARKAEELANAKARKEEEIKKLQETIKERRRREKEEQDKIKAAAIAKAKALRAPKPLLGGEGAVARAKAAAAAAAVATPKSDLLLNSDSEGENASGDDVDPRDIQAFFAERKHLMDADEKDISRQLAKRPAGPVKKLRILRDAKSNRARIAPSMDSLHAKLLEWDIFHTGEDPPGLTPCSKVLSKYSSASDYKSAFLPLLVHEAWRTFVSDKNECTQQPFELKVTTRMNVDNFVEIGTAIPAVLNKNRMLSGGDLVILSTNRDPLHNSKAEHILARIKDAKFKRDVLEITYRISRDPRSSLKPSRINPGIELWAVKVTNMTTIEREFAALESLQHYDLYQEIIDGEVSPKLQYTTTRVEKIQATFNLNAAQAVAVLNATDNDGFTLIQGPPGTGKTKTIVAMIGSLLSNTLNAVQRGVPVKIEGINSEPVGRKKLLVCAPSNAAVDEIVLRLKAGVMTKNGKQHHINILRTGRSDILNPAILDVSLDHLVKQKLEGQESFSTTLSDKDAIHKQAGEIKTKVTELRPRLDAARAAGDVQLESALQREYDSLKRDQAQIGRQIDNLKDQGSTRERDNKIQRLNTEQELIDKAHVICTTLSGSGHHIFRDLKGIDFETVIIDEAAQCVELSALIPLKYGCVKCILVGDPKQLPPTVLSQTAQSFGYDQSLFVRMQQNHAAHVHLLDQQYRMHPAISYFPRREFYDNLLLDGGDMATLRTQEWHRSLYLGPYRFFDVAGQQMSGGHGASLVNKVEVDAVMKLIRRFFTDYGHSFIGKMGVITPYKAQLLQLRSAFERNFGSTISGDVEFNTTDAFQGRECDIIIFSCVRANPQGGIGFVRDIRRMNVGLTRAKSSLWVLGNARALEQGQYWKLLIDDARQRDAFTVAGNGMIFDSPGPRATAKDLMPSGSHPVQIAEHDEMKQRLGTIVPIIEPPDTSQNAVPLVAKTAETESGSELSSNTILQGRIDSAERKPNLSVAASSHGTVNMRKRSLVGGDGPEYPNKRNFSRPPRIYEDPSAMAELGLAPPERAPPPNIPTPPRVMLPGKQRQKPAAKKGPNLFIQKRKPSQPQ